MLSSHSCARVLPGRVRGDDLVAERGQLDADRFAQATHASGDERNARDIHGMIFSSPEV
jgi:hypothetical protein